jgi:hypothetical protein
MKTNRVDDLGRETVFNLVDELITIDASTKWNDMLTNMALGYTRYNAIGGWRGKEELITVYRVASLFDSQVVDCIDFLLHNTNMKDVYVVHKDGVARGHCLEEKETWSYPSTPAPWVPSEVCAYGGTLCDSPYDPLVEKRCRWCPFDHNGEQRIVPRTENAGTFPKYAGVPDRNTPQKRRGD